MKKLLFLLSFNLLFFILQAQEQTFTQMFDNVFMHINRADATTGILYNRVIPFSGLYKYSKPDTANSEVFMQAYYELYNAAFDINKRLSFDSDSLENLISRDTKYVDIGILHYRFNLIDTLVAQQKLHFGLDSVLSENSSISASLYNETTILLISPLIEEIDNNTVTFRFSSLFQFDNTNNPITKLQVNFDDGSGFQDVELNSFITINYPFYDEYTLSFIASYNNGLTDTCFAKLSVGLTSRKDCTAPPFQESGWKHIDSVSFTGYAYKDYDDTTKSNTGKVWVYYANSDKILRKPILIVDGFDPDNPRKHESYDGDHNATTNECGESLWSKLKLVDKPNCHLGDTLLQKYGYDLVVLDLPDGGGYIERNAMVVIKVIQWINQKLQENGSGHEIVVVGPSMGGQITRYALAYMEAHESTYGKHNCRLWISFDSPHQGANISIGTQAWAYYFRGMYGIGKLWNNKLKCVAASQMLIHHFDNDSQAKFNKYYNLTNHTIGYPEKMYYPSNLRRVAVSNGSLYGTKSGNGGDRAFQYNPNLGVEQITSSVYLYPESGDEIKVCDIWHLMPFPPFIIRNHWTVKNNTTKCGIDGAPGCLYNTFFQVKNGYDLFHIGLIVLLDMESHCFMPTTSVLDISGDMDYCTDISNRDLVAEGLTPFQSYCGPGSAKNMEHITFNDHIAKWLFNEIETYISPGNRTIDLCDDPVQYSVHFPAGKSSNVSWTCSKNLQIVSGNGTSIIKVKALSVGEGWIEATLTGNNILTHNKTLKKYSIEVKYKGTSPTNAPETVTSSETWNSPYLVGSNLTISDNATLTLKNTNIYLAEECRIIVEPGSKLIIDGATLTNSCDEPWHGITVEGDLTQPFTSTYQGYVEVKNNGKIENAVCGISVMGGGMVVTNKANFINNKTGIKFQSLSSNKTGTSGSLSNTNFSYTLLTGFAQHLQVNGGGDINVNHCKFIGNNNKGVEIKNIPVNFGVNILEDATISIQPFGTLILTDTLYFAGDATINVQSQGGKLIVDGGILDKYHTEELQWKGITVMGNPYFPIYEYYHGYAEFKNGAKILNAVTGITVQGGGSINVNNTQFINNKTGVKFEPISPANSGTSGTFANTTFEINNNYLGNLTDFSSHLNMQKCANVNVSGCTFSVPQTIFNKNSILINNTKSNWTNSSNLQSAKIYLLSDAEITNTGTINCKEKSSISISSGCTFTHKGNIYSSSSSEITVFSGGELIVDGGKLTNLYTETFWEGITVYGLTSTTPEEKSTDERGYIEMKNGGKIENAICGITLKSGGVVNTNNAQFVNNKTGVKFEPCNIQNLTSGIFSYTTFKIDDNFINGTQGGGNDRGVYSHLIMDNCCMVSVSGCNFSNTSSNIFSDGIIVKNTITNWSNNNTLRDVPLSLTDGATLTLTGKISNKDMDNEGIRVFSPSKLILDGGILTNISLSVSLPDSNDFINVPDTCYSKSLKEEMWKGVTIYGGLTPNEMAMIELTNGGSIEHALCGITVNNYGTVTANNAHFLNNTIGIKFNPIQNNSTFTSGLFNNTNFEMNNDYIGDDPFDTHLFMENSGSVNINHSTFSSNVNKNITKTNKGIVAQNSNLIIGDFSGFSAGPNIQFTGFNTAISGTNSGTTRVFQVLNGIFENNWYGIAIDGINNLEIVNNEFRVSEDGAVGVSLNNATGYKIEENYFKSEINSGTEPNSWNATTFGLCISDSGTEPNEVSLNIFDGLSIGQLFSGINGDEKFGTGLQSLCNTFMGRTGRIHDIYIGRYPNNNPGEIHLIAAEQGNNIVPTGNTFSATIPSIINISNNSYPIPNINYYHGPNGSELPTYNILTPIFVEKEALCESRFDEAKGGNEVSGVRYEVRGNETNQSKSAQSVSSEFYLNDITLIPNPTTGKMKIENGELKIENVEIFDIYGRKQKTESRMSEIGQSEIVINISNLASGVYFVKIYTNAGVVVKKVVKQ